MSEHLHTLLDDGLAALGIACTDLQRERLLAYLGLLHKWNRAYNLTAVRDPAAMVGRHLLDSLSVLPHLGDDQTIADVGSGPGLPGIPLAILCPERRFWLLDSNGKKSRFQRQAIIELGLKGVEAVNARVEQWQPRPQVDLVISRAFASLADMVTATDHLLRPGGRFLAMKGQWPEEELAALPAGFRLARHWPLRVPQCSGERQLLELQRSI